MTVFLEGIAPLAARFDGFLIDQWGVLHDGARPYPGAIAALRRLRAAARRVVLLSNSGRRAAENGRRLAALGFHAGETHDALVTSGEVAADLLARRPDRFFAGLGRRCLLIGPADVVEGIDLDVVRRAGAADFVLLASTNQAEAEGDAQAVLDDALAHRLPLVCSNPDVTAVIDGRKVMSPGALAGAYAERGGTVRLVGKPEPEVYSAALAAAGLAPGQVAVVGDSVAHDMAGGDRAGLATVFVMGGIHAEDLGRQPRDAALAGLAARFAARIDFALPSLRWEAP
ncbi:Ribonucleotide monophosphatase NagD [bacterium YEK0313]|nr:Ribonucleotide monophosphatase NagD [bacterium YEK0313]